MDPALLFTRELLLITGKGGIGKTLLAATIGQEAAARGKRVLMVESSARAQVAPLFGIGGNGHEPVGIRPGFSTLNIDPPDNFREYVVKYLGQKVLYDRVFGHKVVQSFINTIPGLAELMLLGRLFYHAELAPMPRPELVIFDGFASGHFLSLMTTPDAVLQSNLGGPLARETARVKAFLADPARCGIIYVAVPEDLVVSEALDFLPRLAASSPAQVLGVAVNRMPAQPPGAAAGAAGAGAAAATAAGAAAGSAGAAAATAAGAAAGSAGAAAATAAGAAAGSAGAAAAAAAGAAAGSAGAAAAAAAGGAAAAAGAGAAAAYAERRWRDAQAAVATLRAGIAAPSNNGASAPGKPLSSASTGPSAPTSATVGLAAVPIWTFPELGFINEPLPEGFGATFLAAAKGAP